MTLRQVKLEPNVLAGRPVGRPASEASPRLNDYLLRGAKVQVFLNFKSRRRLSTFVLDDRSVGRGWTSHV